MNIPFTRKMRLSIRNFQSLKSILLLLAISAFSASAIAQKAWTPLGATGFSAGGTAYTSIAVDRNNGTPYVFYADSVNGLKGTVKKFNGTDWVVVGRPDFTPGGINYCSITVNRYGVPYIAFVDLTNGYRAMAMQFLDTAWVPVAPFGTPASSGASSYTSIVTDTFGNPYVAFEDFAHGYTATVAHFTGGFWAEYSYLSAGAAEYTSLAADKWGMAYLVCQDGGIGYATTARVLDTNGSWYYIGTPGFSAGWASYTSIAVDDNFMPYVAYQDAGDSNKITVKRYNDTSWVTVGTRGFSPRIVQYVTIAINKATNKPYVSYNDWDFGNYATVMSYDTGTWSLVGRQGFSGGPADFVAMALDTSGTPYVAYKDDYNGSKISVMKFGTAPISGLDSFCKSATDTLRDITPGGTWSSGNTAVATVGALNGVISGVAAGTADITYIVPGFTPFSHRAVFTVTVNPCPEAVANTNAPELTALNVFPDPAHGSFTLNISSAVKEDATVVITNMLGEKVKELKTTTNSNTEIQLNVAPGIYFVSAITTTGQKFSRKVVLQ